MLGPFSRDFGTIKEAVLPSINTIIAIAHDSLVKVIKIQSLALKFYELPVRKQVCPATDTTIVITRLYIF